jgi:hypothetical protein
MRHNKDEALPRSTTVGGSFMNWRGDIALGGNAQVRSRASNSTTSADSPCHPRRSLTTAKTRRSLREQI